MTTLNFVLYPASQPTVAGAYLVMVGNFNTIRSWDGKTWLENVDSIRAFHPVPISIDKPDPVELFIDKIKWVPAPENTYRFEAIKLLKAWESFRKEQS